MSKATERYLLDTHAWLWFLSGDERMSEKAATAIADSTADCFVSMASYWECTIKLSLGKLRLADNWRSVFQDAMGRMRISWLPIERSHIDAINDLPWHHRDPFDRLLIAQAIDEKLSVLSADKHFQKYPISICW